MSDRKALEDLWYERLKGARLRVEAAQLHLHEFLQGSPFSGTYNADGNYAYRQAVKDETIALLEYARVMRIYENLTVRGVLPDEDALAKEADADG